MISRRERWLLGLAAVAAVSIGGWTYGVEPVLERQRTVAELIPARTQVLAKRRELVGRRPAMVQELDETSRRLETLMRRLLTAATPPVAASELQRLVKDAAGGAGLEVRTERILPPIERGDLLEIPVEIAVAGGIRELVMLLQQLDATPKLLTVQDVKIRVVAVGQPKGLLTSLTLSGFILPKPLTLKPL